METTLASFKKASIYRHMPRSGANFLGFGFISLCLVLIQIQSNPQDHTIATFNRAIHILILISTYRLILRANIITLMRFMALFVVALSVRILLWGNSTMDYTTTYTFSFAIALFSFCQEIVLCKTSSPRLVTSYAFLLLLILFISIPASLNSESRLFTFSTIILLIWTCVRLLRLLFLKYSFKIGKYTKILYLGLLPSSVLFLSWKLISSTSVFLSKGLISSRSWTETYFWLSWPKYLPFGASDSGIQTIDGTLHFHNFFYDSWRAAGLLSIPLFFFVITSLIIYMRVSFIEPILAFILISFSIPLEASFLDLLCTTAFFSIPLVLIRLPSCHQRAPV